MKKHSSNWIFLAGGAFLFIIIALVAWFFMNGETKVTGNFPDAESSESISCEALNIDYPFFNTDGANKKSARIATTFSDNELDSISLIYSLYYNSAEDITHSETVNHTNINFSSQKDGLGPDVHNLHFNKAADHLEARFYAKASDINSENAKYLMLNGLPDGDNYSKSLIEIIYEGQGFNCVAKN